MNGCKYIPFNHLFRKNDSILVVVTLPRHECHFKVASESKFSVLGSVSFGKYLTSHNLLSLPYDRLERNGCALVGPAIDRESVSGLLRSKAYELLVFCAIILHADLVCVHISDFSTAFSDNLSAGVEAGSFFKSGTYDR